MNEFEAGQLLGAHLQDSGSSHTISAVNAHRNIKLSQHRVLKPTWRWKCKESDWGYIAFVFGIVGTVSLSTSSREGHSPDFLKPAKSAARGNAVVMRSDHRGTLWFGGREPNCGIVWVPAKVFRDLGVPLEQPIVFADSLLVASLRNVAALAMQKRRRDTKTTHENNALEHTILTLLIGAVAEERQDTGLLKGLGHLELAHKAMLVHLNNPDFDVESLARLLNLSRRQLQRLFSRTGSTPSDTLRTLRLGVARPLLDEPLQPLTREQIARRAGFKSAAALRRAIEADADAGAGKRCSPNTKASGDSLRRD